MPIVEVHHELPECERDCDCCGNQMEKLGVKLIREEVVYVPARLYKNHHIQHSYECNCHNQEFEAKPIKSAVVPRAVFDRSYVGPSLLAQVFHLKYVLSVPLYRQINDWMRIGLYVERKTLANWAINGADYYLKPVYDLLLTELRSRDVAHGDETPFQILNRSDQKPATSQSRMWTFHTLLDAPKPVIVYHSSLTRARPVIEEVMAGFEGYLHCDGYVSYQKINGIITVGCWAHARRYFVEVSVPKDGTSQATTAIRYINKMFKVERELKSLEPVERHKERQKRLKPIIDEFYDWLATLSALGKLRVAVEYALNQKESLVRILEDGRLQLSNNHCEQQIKTLVIGRKNYLFSTSERGADANAYAYSIIATAKVNGLDPFKYLEYLFTHLPNLDFYRQPKLLEDFLPWAQVVKEHCAALPNINQAAS